MFFELIFIITKFLSARSYFDRQKWRFWYKIHWIRFLVVGWFIIIYILWDLSTILTSSVCLCLSLWISVHVAYIFFSVAVYTLQILPSVRFLYVHKFCCSKSYFCGTEIINSAECRRAVTYRRRLTVIVVHFFFKGKAKIICGPILLVLPSISFSCLLVSWRCRRGKSSKYCDGDN